MELRIHSRQIHMHCQRLLPGLWAHRSWGHPETGTVNLKIDASSVMLHELENASASAWWHAQQRWVPMSGKPGGCLQARAEEEGLAASVRGGQVVCGGRPPGGRAGGHRPVLVQNPEKAQMVGCLHVAYQRIETLHGRSQSIDLS